MKSSHISKKKFKISIFILSIIFLSQVGIIQSFCQTSSTNSYAELKKTLDGGYYTTINNVLFFQYTGEYNNGSLNYKVYNYSRSIILSGTLSTKVYGDNRFSITFGCADPSGDFTLEVTDEKGDIVMLRFTHSYVGTPC